MTDEKPPQSRSPFFAEFELCGGHLDGQPVYLPLGWDEPTYVHSDRYGDHTFSRRYDEDPPKHLDYESTTEP